LIFASLMVWLCRVEEWAKKLPKSKLTTECFWGAASSTGHLPPSPILRLATKGGPEALAEILPSSLYFSELLFSLSYLVYFCPPNARLLPLKIFLLHHGMFSSCDTAYTADIFYGQPLTMHQFKNRLKNKRISKKAENDNLKEGTNFQVYSISY